MLKHTSSYLKTVGGIAIVAAIILVVLQQFTAATGILVLGTILCVVIPAVFALSRGAMNIYRHHWGTPEEGRGEGGVVQKAED